MATDTIASTVKNHLVENKESRSIVPQWIASLCTSSRMIWLGPLLGFILCIPFLFSGYFADDYVFMQKDIDHSAFHQRPAWDYFNWASNNDEVAAYREKGILVSWWTPDSFRFHLFRPIASLVHALQFSFISNAPWLMHLGLSLLYALLIFICALVLRRFSLSPAALGIAILLYAIDDTHSYSVSWISSYNTMLCCVFGFFAILMHDTWRRRKSIAGLILSTVACILAVLSSEGGIAVMGYLVSYALFVEAGTWKTRVLSILPGGVIVVGYIVLYTIHNLGANASFGYITPGDDPLHTVFIIASNTVMLALSQLLSCPLITLPLTFSGLAGVVFAVIVLALLVFILKDFFILNRTIAFFTLGMVLSIVPFTLGIGGDRVLLWAGLGAFGLLGEFFTQATSKMSRSQRIVARTLLVTNVFFSLSLFVPLPYLLYSMESGAKKLANIITSEDTVILNDGGAFTSLWAPAICYANRKAWPEHCYFLNGGIDTLIVKRTAERTLTTTTKNGWFSSYLEQSTRPKELYFNRGDKINLQLMTATFEKVTGDRRPISVKFEFKKDLSEFVWINWTKDGPQRCELPTVGGEMKLFTSLF